jgi:hypothetical protein
MDVNNAYENKGHSKQANVYAQSTLIQFCKHLMLGPVAARTSSTATRASAPTKRAASPARDSTAPKRATLDRGELRIYRSFVCELI